MHRFTVKGMARKVPTFEFNLNASTPLGAALAELTGRLFALSAMGAARHLPTLGLLSIFRDEAPWMWEWLAHHALEGAKPLSRISTSSRHWSSIGEIFKLPKLPVVHIVDNSATPHLTEKMGSSRKTEHFSVGGCNSCASLRSDARLLVRPPLLNARPARRRPYQSHRYSSEDDYESDDEGDDEGDGCGGSDCRLPRTRHRSRRHSHLPTRAPDCWLFTSRARSTATS